jgi:predicted AlkP superfamily phosphohydrolase/phosphomutase
VPRVLIAGIDSVPPELLFDRADFDLPFVRSLQSRGWWGEMRSCDPPITVPAWAVMATGRGPERLGLYGFRHRGADLYRGVTLPSSADVREKAVWDLAGEAGRRVAVVGVPPGHPPRAVNGSWISCFLTPSGADYASPPGLAARVESWLGGRPRFDAEFRKDDRDDTLRQVYETTRHKFEVVRRLLREDPWDFAMFVDIGPDRLHHAFWKFADPEHPGYRAGHRFERAVPEYYRFLDDRLRELFAELPPDTWTFVVSDHGSQRTDGCFAVNEWLHREGYLVLKTYPSAVTPLERCEVDWSRTTAWGWGGYYARLFVNRRGREPQGCVPPERYESFRRELGDRLRAVRGADGRAWVNRVTYAEPGWRGDPPDLMVYFDDLRHRSAGSLGHGTPYLTENDTGPDDAVHSPDGVFLLNGPGLSAPGRRRIDIRDVAPTALKLLGVAAPPDLEGKSLV